MRYLKYIYLIACLPLYIEYKIISIKNVRIKEYFDLNA